MLSSQHENGALDCEPGDQGDPWVCLFLCHQLLCEASPHAGEVGACDLTSLILSFLVCALGMVMVLMLQGWSYYG